MSTDVHHVTDGPEDGPVVVLSGSLGSTLEMWDPQVPALVAEGFRVVRYDIRGHGGSPVPDGPYTLADLGEDVVRLLDRIGVERAHVAGLSIGGTTGLWLAANAPNRVARLAVLCTSARYDNPPGWAERAAEARTNGLGAISEATPGRWFTADYLEREPATVARMSAMVRGNSPEGYAACCAALEHADLRADLPRISAPTLVVAGADDPATPPRHAETIAAGIGGARLRVLRRAAHLASWERADAVNTLLRGHFAGRADLPAPEVA